MLGRNFPTVGRSVKYRTATTGTEIMSMGDSKEVPSGGRDHQRIIFFPKWWSRIKPSLGFTKWWWRIFAKMMTSSFWIFFRKNRVLRDFFFSFRFFFARNRRSSARKRDSASFRGVGMFFLGGRLGVEVLKKKKDDGRFWKNIPTSMLDKNLCRFSRHHWIN